MAERIYKLTSKGYRMLKSRGADLICRICGKPIKPGDRIVVKPSRYRWKRFHYACYQSLLH